MPQEIVTTFTSAIKDFKDKLPDLFDDNTSYEETYEEIMKRFMKYSANEKFWKRYFGCCSLVYWLYG
mgnify:CR=1 FL=1